MDFTEQDKIQQAVELYFSRQGRVDPNTKPQGAWFRGVWYPHPDETEKCCQHICLRLKRWPHPSSWGYMKHCCTIRHIATKYEVDYKYLSWVIKCEKQRRAEK